MPRLMLVDDAPVMRASMVDALAPFGFELVQAEDGRQAVELGMASRWDLLLLDVAMPNMNGIEALATLRSAGCTSPAVLVTTTSTAPVVANAVRLGGVHYLAKPYTPDMLRAVVLRLLHLPPTYTASAPRALILHGDSTLAAEIATALPPRTVLDVTSDLADALTLAATYSPTFVMLDSAGTSEGTALELARQLRSTAPAAGIFTIARAATPLGWAPSDALDGALSVPLDAELVTNLIDPTFLRPLVFIDGWTLRVAGDTGHVRHREVYYERILREIVARCAAEDIVEPEIDLRDVPGDPARLTTLVLRVDEQLRACGGAPAFKLAQPGDDGALAHVCML